MRITFSKKEIKAYPQYEIPKCFEGVKDSLFFVIEKGLHIGMDGIEVYEKCRLTLK